MINTQVPPVELQGTLDTQVKVWRKIPVLAFKLYGFRLTPQISEQWETPGVQACGWVFDFSWHEFLGLGAVVWWVVYLHIGWASMEMLITSIPNMTASSSQLLSTLKSVTRSLF